MEPLSTCKVCVKQSNHIDVVITFVVCIASDDPFKITDETRNLGLVVCRGTTVVLVCPADSMEAIANPFIQQEL